MEEIPVNKDFLTDFLRGNGSSASGVESLNGSEDQTDDPISKAFDKGLAWLLGKVDRAAKERDLPGLEEMDPKEIGELITIVLEKHFGTEFKKYSPEGMLLLVGGGLLTTNLIALKRQQLDEADEQAD